MAVAVRWWWRCLDRSGDDKGGDAGSGGGGSDTRRCDALSCWVVHVAGLIAARIVVALQVEEKTRMNNARVTFLHLHRPPPTRSSQVLSSCYLN